MSNIVCNKICTPDGTIIESKHVHDFVAHKDANGYTYYVDGGKEYLKRGYTPGAPTAQELSVYSNDPHEIVRESLQWGTRGVDGKQPLSWVSLKDMTVEHIKACLDTQTQMSEQYRGCMENELKFRKHNG
jgi:hypothetical protein